MLRHVDRVLEIRRRAAGVDVGYHQRILEHDVVEASALQSLRHFNVELAVPRITARRRQWLAPLVDREIAEPCQMKLFLGHDMILSE